VIKVLIADDNEYVRDALVELFTLSDDISVVAVCADGDEVVPAAERTQPDVLVLDLAMPKVTGLEAARALMATRPDSRVVMLTGSFSVASLREARDLGVMGYLLKEDDPGDLLGHVRAVAAGGTAWSGTVTQSAPYLQ
jgi:DNA-binding NarL/FixJ family response regulator